MNKIVFFTLISFFLWACSDGSSTGSETYTGDVDTSSSEESSSSIEAPSSEIRNSASSEPDEDESCCSSTEENEESPSIDQKSSSSSKRKKSSSSKSKSKSSSSSNSKTKSSSSSNSITSSSSDEYCTPTQTYSSSESYLITLVSPIRMQPLTVKPNADKSEFTFTGGAVLERPCVPEDSYREPYFTSVQLVLARVNEFGQNEQTRINIQYTQPTLPAQAIDFAQMGVKISDSAKTQCGNFRLFVVLTATDDPEMDNRFVSVDSIEFVREPIYCEAEPKSSSSAAMDSVVRKVEIKKFNGQMSTSKNRGFSFKEDAEVPIERANVRVSMDELTWVLTLHGVNGYKVVEYDNDKDRYYYDDWYAFDLPSSPVYTTDFRFTEANLTDSTFFDKYAFWIVIGPAFNKETADDFFAITLKSKDIPNEEGVSPLEIIYYKK